MQRLETRANFSLVIVCIEAAAVWRHARNERRPRSEKHSGGGGGGGGGGVPTASELARLSRRQRRLAFRAPLYASLVRRSHASPRLVTKRGFVLVDDRALVTLSFASNSHSSFWPLDLCHTPFYA